MNTHPMKLVTIVCEAHARDAVTKLLRAVAFHREEGPAVGSDFAQEFGHDVARVGFADNRHQLHRVRVHVQE